MTKIVELIKEYSKKEGEYVISGDLKSIGEILTVDEEGLWDCGVESCRGSHYIVKWGEETTFVCGKGLDWKSENVAIIL